MNMSTLLNESVPDSISSFITNNASYSCVDVPSPSGVIVRYAFPMPASSSIKTESLSPSTVEIPTPSGFSRPSYAFPALSISSTSEPKSSTTAASFAAALAHPPPETLPFPHQENGSDDEFDEDNPEWAKWDCNQIRNKIRRFLGTKEMTQTAFLKLIDVNSNSYRRFMSYSGPDTGNGNYTFEGASIFFYRREQKEKEEKAKLKAMSPKDRKRKATEQKEAKVKRCKDGDDLLKRIEEVKLPDMNDDGTVPVYDDCDEIRRKINSFLRDGSVTKAAFLRALGDVNSNSLRRFMSMKRGADSGAASVVYRTAYVFLEKKRLLDGKKKTATRLKNEEWQGPDGFSLSRKPNMFFIDKVLEQNRKKRSQS